MQGRRGGRGEVPVGVVGDGDRGVAELGLDQLGISALVDHE